MSQRTIGQEWVDSKFEFCCLLCGSLESLPSVLGAAKTSGVVAPKTKRRIHSLQYPCTTAFDKRLFDNVASAITWVRVQASGRRSTHTPINGSNLIYFSGLIDPALRKATGCCSTRRSTVEVELLWPAVLIGAQHVKPNNSVESI